MVKSLHEHKQDILNRWRQLIVATYPEQTSLFLQRERDRFANPVGAAIAAMASAVVDELNGGEIEPARLNDALEDFVKIRAIQDFTPSDAVKFIFLLKQPVAEAMLASSASAKDFQDLLAVHAAIDRIALLAFDLYTGCREKLLDIRLGELKRSYIRTHNLPR